MARTQRLTICMLATAAFALQVTSGAAAERPNILLIVSDDQGYNDLGQLGNGIITPALDRLAEEGTRLTNFYVAWPACTPSRASLLTGRYPQRNGIYDMIRNEAPDYGHRYSPEEYAVTFERIGGMDPRRGVVAARDGRDAPHVVEVSVGDQHGNRLEAVLAHHLGHTVGGVLAGVDDDALRPRRRGGDVTVGAPGTCGESGDEHSGRLPSGEGPSGIGQADLISMGSWVAAAPCGCSRPQTATKE